MSAIWENTPMLPFYQSVTPKTQPNSRRELLRIGGLSTFGLSLEHLLNLKTPHAQAMHPLISQGFGQAQACILVYLFGGPSQLDTFDMKPDAPRDFRGDFKPVSTNVPGIDICEHFKHLTLEMDQITVLRSMTHLHPRHGYGLYYMFTGRPHTRPDLDAPPTPDDFPGIGSLIAKLHPHRADIPAAVTLPRWNRFLDLPNDYAGEKAGFLGSAYDPWLIKADPPNFNFHVEGIELPHGLTPARLTQRQALLSRLDRQIDSISESSQNDQYRTLYQQAFALISNSQTRQAFRLGREPRSLRERYGMHPMGQGLLLARRLVEAGVRLVTVNWHNDGSDVKSPFWDTHKANFSTLRNQLIPPFDQGLAALLNDLRLRGMLESTLVVVMGEFGRTPKIGRVVMNAATDASGRDHWPHAFSTLLAGAGIKGGHIHGATDPRAAYVTESPVTPPDLTATLLHLLGIPPETTLIDRFGQPQVASTGTPVLSIM